MVLEVLQGFWYYFSSGVISLAAALASWVRYDLRPKNRWNVFSRYLFPVIILYYEIVFIHSTVRPPFGFRIVYIVLYSLFWGLIGYLLTTNLKPRYNRRVRCVLIFVIMLPYMIEYFVYRQFKVLYDLNTVTAGAGGVVTDFMSDIIHLVFSPGGLIHIFLFMLPCILYWVLLRRIDRAKRIRMKRRIRTLIAVIGVYIVTLLLVLIHGGYRPSYKTEYNFQTAVGNFGLMTGLRMELRQKWFGGNQVAFEVEETVEETEPVPEVKVYGDNKLNINFDMLAQSASGTNVELDTYVATQKASKENDYTGLFKGKNLIMITAEAFSGDIISPTLTPTLYRLANKGIKFTDYIMPATAGTTGGEYEHIFGMYPTDGGSSMKDTETFHNLMTMGSQLDRLGYYGKAYHNNNYEFYDRNLTHINLGYSDGFLGYGNGIEAYVTKQWPESDLEMFQGSFEEYVNKEPFNIYYMTVSGHSEYSQKSNAMTKKHWDDVADLTYSDGVKSYIACNLELEAGLTWLVNALEQAGIADDTVIVMTADHFPYGLDKDAHLGNMPLLSELYGYNVENLMQRDHNTLIIWSGCLEKMDPIVVNDPVSVIDILPTMSNLFDTEWDSRLFPGRDVFSDTDPLAFNLSYDWKTDKGTYINATKTFTPKDDSVVVPEDYVSSIRKIVRNKITYMKGFLETDYYGHVFENYTFSDEKIVRNRQAAGVPVTDEDGQPVTDENGETVTAPAPTETAPEVSGEAATAEGDGG